ncbi:hypothetical protein BC628DRAFT_1041237 [Trametes gibbosa]|nr:hypothetical protein BC628DRAFT_1041237 [Trametes gibbosa]
MRYHKPQYSRPRWRTHAWSAKWSVDDALEDYRAPDANQSLHPNFSACTRHHSYADRLTRCFTLRHTFDIWELLTATPWWTQTASTDELSVCMESSQGNHCILTFALDVETLAVPEHVCIALQPTALWAHNPDPNSLFAKIEPYAADPQNVI